MEIIIFLVGFLFASFGVFIVWESTNFKKNAATSMGIVVAIEIKEQKSRDSGNTEVYAPVIQYNFGGQQHQFTAKVSSSHISHQIGDAVPILVDKSNPDSARVANSPANTLGYLFAVIGIGMVIGFFFVFDYSSFSIGIAVIIISVVLIKLIMTLRRLGIRSVRDIKKGISKIKKFGIHGTTTLQNGSRAKIITDNATFERHTKQGKKVPAWFAGLFLLIGIGALIGGIYLFNQRADFLETALRSQGLVVSFNSRTSTSEGTTTTTYYPIVDFKPQGFDSNIRFEHDSGSSKPGYHKGQAVPVLYSPLDNNKAIIDEGWQNWLGPIILTILGIVFTLTALLTLRTQRNIKKQQNKLTLDI